MEAVHAPRLPSVGASSACYQHRKGGAIARLQTGRVLVAIKDINPYSQDWTVKGRVADKLVCERAFSALVRVCHWVGNIKRTEQPRVLRLRFCFLSGRKGNTFSIRFPGDAPK